MMKRSLLFAVFALTLCATPALAHKVNVFAVIQGKAVVGEGYFTGGAKPQGCTVELMDAQGQVLAQGETTAEGSFSVPLPKGAAAPLTVVLKAGEGHRGDFVLTAKDFEQDAAPAAGSEKQKAQTGKSVQSASSAQSVSNPLPATAGIAPSAGAVQLALPADEARLAALIESACAKAVEEKLAPVKLSLAKMAAQEQDVRIKDIIGGLGWIIGLAGIAAWVRRPDGGAKVPPKQTDKS